MCNLCTIEKKTTLELYIIITTRRGKLLPRTVSPDFDFPWFMEKLPETDDLDVRWHLWLNISFIVRLLLTSMTFLTNHDSRTHDEFRMTNDFSEYKWLFVTFQEGVTRLFRSSTPLALHFIVNFVAVEIEIIFIRLSSSSSEKCTFEQIVLSWNRECSRKENVWFLKGT